MATLLLIVIYIAFIGLGLPDSLFGTAWPAVYVEFGVPVSLASIVNLISCFATFLSSMWSARIINRFGTGKVTAVSTLLTVVGLFGYSLSQNFVWLCILAIPMGFGAGAIDAGLNNYVALYYNAAQMNFLHCFYGIGVTVSPYLMSIALAETGNWRGGYRMACFIQMIITAILILALPLWSKAPSPQQSTAVSEEPRTLSMRQLARMPAVRCVWLVFVASCGIECTVGAWCSTYLVQTRQMAVDAAARIVMLYYLGFALGRFLSGILAGKWSSWRLVSLGHVLLVCAIVLLVVPAQPAAAIGMFLVGVGNGPIFPNMTHLTPKNFGRDISQSVIGSQMAAAYVGIMALPPLFGLLTQFIGAWLLPYYLLIMFVLMAVSTIRLITEMKKEGRYQS